MHSGRNSIVRIIRVIIDILNIILALSVIVLAVMVFIDTDKNSWMFTIIIASGATVNLISGIKFFMTKRNAAGIVSEIAAVILFVISYICYRTVGGA